MLLPMIECLDIARENDMPVRHEPSWRLRRRPAPRPDGQQRWDPGLSKPRALGSSVSTDPARARTGGLP